MKLYVTEARLIKSNDFIVAVKKTYNTFIHWTINNGVTTKYIFVSIYKLINITKELAYGSFFCNSSYYKCNTIFFSIVCTKNVIGKSIEKS